MDEIIRVVAENAVTFLFVTVAPIALALAIRAMRRAAAKTPNKIDDAAVKAIADAVNARGDAK
jgi:hypothetical protein